VHRLDFEISGRLPLRRSEGQDPARTVARATVLAAIVFLLTLGPGAGPRVAVAPRQVDFGTSPVGSPASLRRVVVSNPGRTPLHLALPAVEGDEDFRLLGDCPERHVDPGESCGLEVGFTPAQGGQRVAFLVLASDAPDSRIGVPLVGYGQELQGPRLVSDPGYLDFEEPSGGSSSQPIVLNSTGDAPAVVSTVAIAGSDAFRADKDCEGQTLSKGENCVVNVTFESPANQPPTAWLVVEHDDEASPLRIPLRGLALLPSPPPPGQIVVEPDYVIFRRTRGKIERERALQVSNAGAGPLKLLAADVKRSRTFGVRDSCSGRTLAPQEACRLLVFLEAVASGEETDELLIRSDNRTVTVPLVADFQEPTHPRVNVSPKVLYVDPEGAGSLRQLVTVASQGDAPLRIDGYSISDGQGYEVSTGGLSYPCRPGQELAPNEACQVQVSAIPGRKVAARASLEIHDDADPSPQRVAIVLVRRAPQLGTLIVGDYDPDFGDVLVPPKSANGPIGASQRIAAAGSVRRVITLGNSGPGPLHLLALSEPHELSFRLDRGDCGPGTLAPGQTCQIAITFEPDRLGLVTATVGVEHDGGGQARRQLELRGRGILRYIDRPWRRAIQKRAPPADAPVVIQ
jgi:Abnormal spindle-like microcephaly-assoc'd, ASPM-SPD-2-Hydin